MNKTIPLLFLMIFLVACKTVSTPETVAASNVERANCAPSKNSLRIGSTSSEFRNGMMLTLEPNDGDAFQYELFDENKNCVFSFVAGKRVIPAFSEKIFSSQEGRKISTDNPSLADLKSNLPLTKGTLQQYSKKVASKIVSQCGVDHIEVQSFQSASFTLFSYFPKPDSYFQNFWRREVRNTPARIEFEICRKLERRNLLNLKFEGIGKIAKKGSFLELAVFGKEILYWGKYIEYSRN
ncbi:MAG: hypothetical protein ABJN34_13035 [Litoreibacter sp.]|uniref:hypothetical protein n=1 Tax=Litoreibacter sp. TaxID=1969459 RepID=UPI003299F4A6